MERAAPSVVQGKGDAYSGEIRDRSPASCLHWVLARARARALSKTLEALRSPSRQAASNGDTIDLTHLTHLPHPRYAQTARSRGEPSARYLPRAGRHERQRPDAADSDSCVSIRQVDLRQSEDLADLRPRPTRARAASSSLATPKIARGSSRARSRSTRSTERSRRSRSSTSRSRRGVATSAPRRPAHPGRPSRARQQAMVILTGFPVSTNDGGSTPQAGGSLPTPIPIGDGG